MIISALTRASRPVRPRAPRRPTVRTSRRTLASSCRRPPQPPRFSPPVPSAYPFCRCRAHPRSFGEGSKGPCMGGHVGEYRSICRRRLVMVSGVLECVPPVVEHGGQGEWRGACVSPEGFAESVPRLLVVSHRHVQARDTRHLLWLGVGGAVCQAESEGGRAAARTPRVRRRVPRRRPRWPRRGARPVRGPASSQRNGGWSWSRGRG